MEEEMVDKDRIIGSAKVVKGNLKEAVGKAVGDAKLEGQGKADKIEGKVQNAWGKVKDAVKKPGSSRPTEEEKEREALRRDHAANE